MTNEPETMFPIYDEKVPCFVFYIQPNWDHRAHKVFVALPENWNTLSEVDKEKLAQEWFEEWCAAQIEDSGWTLGRAYPDEIDI